MCCFQPLTVRLWPTFQKIASYSFHQAGQGAMCDPNVYPRSRFLSLSALDGVYSKMFRLPIASNSSHQAGQGAMCDPNAYPRSRFLSLSALDGVYSKMFRLPRTSACIYCTPVCRVLLKWVEICYKKMKENRADGFYNMFIAIYD